MAYHSFEDLDVWKRSKTLAVHVCRLFAKCDDWGLRDQIRRAAISIPSNVAEGCERLSKKEFRQFLGIARGSCAEVRTQLIIAQELNYLTKDQLNSTLPEAIEISKMLFGLIRSLENSA